MSYKTVPKLGKIPAPKNYTVSKVMRANKRENTKLEIQFKRILKTAKISDYESNFKELPGSPDIAFPKQRIAIFINGCFWHHCKICNPRLPKTHKEFWKRKFIRNSERDVRKKKDLEKLDWHVVTFWEHEINNNPSKVIKRLKRILNSRS